MWRERPLIEKCHDKGFDAIQIHNLHSKYHLDNPFAWSLPLHIYNRQLEMAHAEIDHTKHYEL